MINATNIIAPKCLQCQQTLVRKRKGKKTKQFCSAKCRAMYWRKEKDYKFVWDKAAKKRVGIYGYGATQGSTGNIQASV